MPGLMSVAEFVAETKEDYNSPTTSTFVGKMSQCRQTIGSLEETLDFDRDGLTKMKKAIKAIFNSGNAHVDNEVFLSRALDRLGANAMTKDQEPDIGAAFIKFSIVTKELSALMKTLMQNLNNIIMFPLDNLLKGDLRGVKGDLKRPFDKAWRDYETKMSKIEKEKKQQAKEAGLIRTEISPAEVAEEMEKERKMFQLQMCEYFIKVNEIKTKKGAELLQHLVEYYHAQNNYFQDGLKTIKHFSDYISELAANLQRIRQKQDEERKNLVELRNTLRNSVSLDAKESLTSLQGGYSLHPMQGNQHYGYNKSGHLLKKSDGKIKKVWQKRRCEIKDGFLHISHSDETKPPTKLNLLTCQVKTIPEEKRYFDLVSYNRTYHFQAEDEAEAEAWLAVLLNSKEGALRKAFDDSGHSGTDDLNQSLLDLQQSIIRQVQKMPGNDRCVDCSSTKDPTWLSTNFGILTCIECSGIHRDMGVHISRIQSLTLDNIGTSQLLLARKMSNAAFNEVMEENLTPSRKLTPSSTMDERYEFIRAKYVQKQFVSKTLDASELLNELERAVRVQNLTKLLWVFAQGADLSSKLPSSPTGETALHIAIAQEDNTSLHIVDFLVQNSSSLDKQTSEGWTALHVCAHHNQTECMKLLLRSGANTQIENDQGQTPADLARHCGHMMCLELLEHANQNKKALFENINIDWGLTQDDASTDFSDEDFADDRITPERRSRSRPSSVVGGGSESPTNRTTDLTTSGDGGGGGGVRQSPAPSSRASMPPPPPPQHKKPSICSLTHQGSIKKRAPPPPSSSVQHSRTPSDPGLGQSQGNLHRRNHSTDLGGGDLPNLVGARQVLPRTTEFPTLKSTSTISSGGTLQRPKVPPPPTPSSANNIGHTSVVTSTSGTASNEHRLSNGAGGNTTGSAESLLSISSTDTPTTNTPAPSVPVPPPRKSTLTGRGDGSSSNRPRRCQALYDCEADRDDELSFKVGEIIVILNETTDDEDWMEGMIEGSPCRRGVFPASFVHILHD